MNFPERARDFNDANCNLAHGFEVLSSPLTKMDQHL